VRLFNRRGRWAKLPAVALAITPLLYILSSVPIAMVTFHTRVTQTATVLPNGASAITATSEHDRQVRMFSDQFESDLVSGLVL